MHVISNEQKYNNILHINQPVALDSVQNQAASKILLIHNEMYVYCLTNDLLDTYDGR